MQKVEASSAFLAPISRLGLTYTRANAALSQRNLQGFIAILNLEPAPLESSAQLPSLEAVSSRIGL